MIEVDDDIALPKRRGRVPKYPFEALGVGQSFFAPGIRQINTIHWRRRTGHSFIVRQLAENGVNGVRVWRTA